VPDASRRIAVLFQLGSVKSVFPWQDGGSSRSTSARRQWEGRELNMARLISAWSFRVFAIVLASIAASETTLAAPPAEVGYSLFMSPYAPVLDALAEFGEASDEFHDVADEAMWDNPHIRVRARNKPALMLINDPASEAPLTSFSLTINEGPYVFGSGDFITDNFTGFIQNTTFTDPGVTITGSSLSADQKTLTVNFDGLTAGSKALFNVDLDPTDASIFPYPDYRVVLCGAPTSMLDAPNATATIMATFTSTTMGPPNNTTTLEMDLEQVAAVPEFFDQFVRAAKAMEMIDIKEKNQFIPEPNGLVLAMAGAAMTLLSRRRR
jgi:hypothetical protein